MTVCREEWLHMWAITFVLIFSLRAWKSDWKTSNNNCRSARFAARAINYVSFCLAISRRFFACVVEKGILRWNLTKQAGSESDPPAVPPASQTGSSPGLEGASVPLLGMLVQRGCCWGLSDETQQVAKKWLPAQVCPRHPVNKGGRGAWGCPSRAAGRSLHGGTACSRFRMSSASRGANAASTVERGERERQSSKEE